MSSRSKHTILLIQKTPSLGSRTYQEFETVSAAMDALCKSFEGRLQHDNPGKAHLTYDVSQLLEYVRGFHEICALTFEPEISAYRPFDKNWVCKRLYAHLKSSVGRQ